MPTTSVRRFHSNVAQPTTLTGPCTNTDTVLSVQPIVGWPGTYPYIVFVDVGTVNQEEVLVTASTSTTLTVSRGQNGSAAVAHGTGSTVRHMVAAVEADESSLHGSATSSVHGVTGNVVGTTDVQTLTSKTLTQPIIGDFTNAAHDHNSVVGGGNIPQSAVTNLVDTITTLGAQDYWTGTYDLTWSLSSSSWTTVAPNTPIAVRNDSGAGIYTSGDHTFTAPIDGFYLYFFCITFGTNDLTGRRLLQWQTQGATILGQTEVAGGASNTLSLTAFNWSPAGYKLTARAYQDSGSTLSNPAHSGATPCYFAVARLI